MSAIPSGRARAVAVEICVDALDGVRAAVAAGAHRIEVCSGLAEGGVTPSFGLLEQARVAAAASRHGCEVVALLRPRPGDFVYDAAERRAMRRDITLLRSAGAQGFALGALTREGTIDVAAMRELVEGMGDATRTFHRAFDYAAGRREALEQLIELGFDRVLSSAGVARAVDAVRELRELVELARGRLAIVAAGGVRAAHVAQLVEVAGVNELHSSARGRSHAASARGHDGPRLGAAVGSDPSARDITDPAEVARLIVAAAGL